MNLFNRQLLVLYINRLISLVGEYGSFIIISLMISERGAFQVMLLWIIQSLGPVLVLPIIGRVIDSFDKKKIMIISDILRGLLILSIPLFINSYFLFVIILFVSMLRPFFTGAMQPIITSITNKDNRKKVNAIISSISSSAYCVGPMVGGALFLLNNNLPFYVQSIGLISSSFLFFVVTFPNIESTLNFNKKDNLSQRISHAKEDLLFSCKYIFNKKLILIIFASNIFFFAGSTALDAYEVLYVTEVLGMTELDYSLAISYLGFAFIVASLLIVFISSRFSSNNLLVIGVGFGSVSNILFTTANSPNIVYVSFALLAIGMTSFSTGFASINQSTIPIDKQGRIISFQNITPQIFVFIAVLLAGLLFNFLEIRIIVVSLALFSSIGFLVSLFVYKISNVTKNHKINADVRM